MQIACPSCKARVSVPDDKIKPTGTKVKCGKCAKIFTVKKKSSPQAEAAPKKKPETPAAPASAPSSGADDLDDLFGGPPDEPKADEPAPAPKSQPPEPDDDLGLGSSSAPVGEDEVFDGDNFGAEMDNYKTQLRPMAGARDDDLFGTSSQLDDASSSPSRDEEAADLFGSGDDLLGESGEKSVGSDSPFGDDGPQHAEPKAKRSSMPGKEDLDDLFGKGLDDDPSDELVNKLLEQKPKKKPAEPAEPSPPNDDLDDLFAGDQAQRESPANAPASDKLDALFEDDAGEPEVPTPPKPKKKKSEPETLDLAGGPKKQQASGNAKDLASSMELEPALTEDDVPRPAASKPADKKPAMTKKKKKSSAKGIVLVIVLLTLIGGAAATVFVPAVNKPVMGMINKIPFDELFAKIIPSSKPPEPEPIKIGVSVRGGRALTGGRGDKLYVLEGTVQNNYPGSRSFIKVKGTLTDEEGNVIAEREVYAGNVLNDDEIRGLERVRIDGILNRSVGGGLQNFNVAAGSTIPFQIVFYDVEQPVSNHRVEPIGAEPGS